MLKAGETTLKDLGLSRSHGNEKD